MGPGSWRQRFLEGRQRRSERAARLEILEKGSKVVRYVAKIDISCTYLGKVGKVDRWARKVGT